ncbi:hypothetical protein ABE47_06005 [Bacillus thuringiensis]|uniref:ATP-binding protein n=1 Tax=Bacillus thuringiensis TaxID=1428 RepID=UPI0018CD7D9C|nr:ATP-binding protein [Bacillus thuringiensis]MBG9511746.1 hypothetical protein [Bacillus thuringiensis]
MQSLGKTITSSKHTTFKEWTKQYVVSANRCQNTFVVGQNQFKDVCNKRMLLDLATKEEFCPHCRVVEQEDQRLAEETVRIKQKQEIVDLYDSFANHSLINEKLKKAMFENYKPPNKSLSGAKQDMKHFVDTFAQTEPTSRILTGGYGIGKSHLCVAASKELMKRGHSALFIQMNMLFTKIKETWHKNSDMTEGKLMSLLAKVDVLILDDFGAEFTEKDREGVTWKQTKTNEIVDSRVGKSTLFTTNFTVKELGGMYGERDFSRMMENAEVLHMHGENYRLRNFKKTDIGGKSE